MANLMQVNREWSSRPNDERFLSLHEYKEKLEQQKLTARSLILSSRAIHARPVEDEEHKALAVQIEPQRKYSRGSEDMIIASPTHWSFGQLAQRAGAPAGYLRTLPAEMAADCVNYGLFKREVEEIGVYTFGVGPEAKAVAVTGPRYGRVLNLDVVKALIRRFGDGVTGDFRVPGVFGHKVEVTRENTTLYGSDRDMFVFLADEDHRIEVPNRRDGHPGTLARGFFVWNSEVGAQTLGIALFLYDYVCGNRIVWGAEEYKEIRIRHTAAAPERFIEEVTPALAAYAESSAQPVQKALEAARNARLPKGNKLDDFLSQRFTKSQVTMIKQAHEDDEGRPMETYWDAVVGATAYARGISYQDERVDIERKAGKILDLAKYQ